jgi:hypothetical protein
MNVTKEKTPLRSVLYAFSLETAAPDAAVLDDFVCKYPEYADELTDFAVEMILDAASDHQNIVSEAVGGRISPSVSRAMSRFENRLFEARRIQGPTTRDTSAQLTTVQNPFAVLDRTAFRALVNGLHANNLFVSRLRDREIDVNTMSAGFKRRVADELNAPLDLVTAHFSAEAQIERRQFYKAEEKPEVSRKTSFEEAVRNSGLTKEQQRYLLTL